MLNMQACHVCHGDKLRIESLNVFVTSGKKKYNIAQLQKFKLDELSQFFSDYLANTKKNKILVERITKPLLDRIQTIQDL
jgi:excinuclease UvrABC ATPase subunit